MKTLKQKLLLLVKEIYYVLFLVSFGIILLFSFSCGILISFVKQFIGIKEKNV